MSIPKILPNVIRAFPVYSEIADSITETGVTPMADKSIASKQYAVPINMPPTIPAFIIPDANFFQSNTMFCFPMLKYVPAIIFISMAAKRTGRRLTISFIIKCFLSFTYLILSTADINYQGINLRYISYGGSYYAKERAMIEGNIVP